VVVVFDLLVVVDGAFAIVCGSIYPLVAPSGSAYPLKRLVISLIADQLGISSDFCAFSKVKIIVPIGRFFNKTCDI
jgi:hypothetical protein